MLASYLLDRLQTKRKALVIGAGRSGMAAVRLLLAKSIEVTLYDDKPDRDLRFFADTEVPAHPLLSPRLSGRQDIDWDEMAVAVLSPGVPQEHPMVTAVRVARIPIINEIDLASLFLPQLTAIGITGSNGKSTTTAMLEGMLKAMGRKAIGCGNLGMPLCEVLLNESLDDDSFLVIELSSFQLELLFLIRLDAAIITNITPNHLDRYKAFADYKMAKLNIVSLLKDKGVFIFNRTIATETSGRKGICFDAKEMTAALSFLSESWIAGEHNRENMMAAAIAAMHLGVSPQQILKALSCFKPLPHRCEIAGIVDGITFIDDSKGTTVVAAKKALSMHSSPTHLLLGGIAKGENFADLNNKNFPHIAGYYVYGQAREKILSELLDPRASGYSDLGSAFKAACDNALPGDVVLLSPGCSSYDQFDDYQHRGEIFKRLVAEMRKNDIG